MKAVTKGSSSLDLFKINENSTVRGSHYLTDPFFVCEARPFEAWRTNESGMDDS